MSTVIDSFDSDISGWTSSNPSYPTLVKWISNIGPGSMQVRSAYTILIEAYRTIDVSSFNNRLRFNIAKVQAFQNNLSGSDRLSIKIIDVNGVEVKSETPSLVTSPNMSANGDGTYSGYIEFDFTVPDPTETYELRIGPLKDTIQNDDTEQEFLNVYVDSITSEVINHQSQTLPASKYRFLMTRSHDVNYTKMTLTDFRMIDDSGVDVLDYAIGTNSSSNPNDTLLSYDNSKETLWTNNYEIFPGSQNGDHWFEIQFSVANFNLHRIEFYSKTEMRDWKLQKLDSEDNWQDVLDFTDYPQATENEWDVIFIEDQTTVYSDSSESDFNAWDVFEESDNIYSRVSGDQLLFYALPPADNFAKVGKNIQYNFIEGESYTVKFNIQRGSLGQSQSLKDSFATHLINIRVLEDGPTLTNANSTGWTALAESIDITWGDTFLPGNTEDYATLYLNFTANSQVASDGSVYVYLSTGGAFGTSQYYSVYLRANSFELLAPSSSAQTYSVTETANNINEGSALTIDVSTTNVADSTELHWTIESNSGDFNVSSGSFLINSDFGSFTITPTADNTTEGDETFTVAIRTDSITGNIVATTGTITINDESQDPVPTYSLSANLDSADEGSVVILTLQTTHVAENETVPFTINGSGIVLEDFVNLDSLGAGEFTVGADGSATFNLEINSDSTTEGPETFTVVLDDHPEVSVDVDINDTSTTPQAVSQTPVVSSQSISLPKDPTSKTYYLGWYGECDGSTCQSFDLTTLSEDDIYRVYEYSSDNKLATIYTPNSPFNTFTTLECGKNYGIVLKSQSTGGTSVYIPRFVSTNSGTTGSLLLTDNCEGSPISSHSTPLPKDATSKTYYLGWYGECSTASDFDLTTLSADDIYRVYEYSSDNKLATIYTPNSPFNTFTTLEKGKNYGIVLKSQSTGGTSVDISGFISTNSGTTGSLLLTNNCGSTPSNLQLTSQFNPIDEDSHTEIELSKVDGTPLTLGDLYTFTISGSNITPDDFLGWATHDQLMGGGSYTPFDSNLDGILTVDSSGTASIEIKTRADSTTEGPETFTVTLDDHPQVSVDVTINDTSVSGIPGTLQIQPHFNNAGPSDDATEVEPSSAGDPFYDYHYFKVTIPDWTGGSQLLTWEIIQDPFPGIDPEDIQIYPRQSSSSGGEVTVNADGMSGTWQTSDYFGTGFGYQEFTPIYVLHDNLNETEYYPSENFTLKVTDEDGNSSTVIGRIEDPS